VVENVFPPGCNNGCNSNNIAVRSVGTEAMDQVGGTESNFVFQTFNVIYQGVTYSLPQELVHEVNVGPDGSFTTTVYEIVPDAIPWG
jgi:hypothetical protein